MQARDIPSLQLIHIMMKLHVLPVPPSNNFAGGEGEALLCAHITAQMLSSNAWRIALCT